MGEPLVFRLVRQHQAEQEAKKARHSPGNARKGGVRRGPVGRRRRFLLLGDRLTARPKHPDFRERVSLRGAAKERRSPVDVENVRRALQAFVTPRSTTEGARGFRRRGAHAHRSPGDGARQKRAAERSKSVGPLLGGLGPCCSEDPKPNLGSAFELPISHLGGELAVARRHRFPRGPAEKLGENPGRRERRKASRGAPQTMLQKARLLQNKARPHRKVWFIAR